MTSAPPVRSHLARPAVLGGFDGLASLLGVAVYLLVKHPGFIFPAALSGALSSAISMGGGEWLSESDNGFTASSVMGASTFAGVLLPALPFAFGSGPGAVASSAVICVLSAVVVGAMRPNRGLGLAVSETLGILLLAFGVTLACAVTLPGGAA